MPKILADFKGSHPIFLDANIFLFHAFDSNESAVDFLKKIEIEGYKAYTSSLVLEEVFFKLTLQSASNFIDHLNLQTVKIQLRDIKKRKRIMAPVLSYLKYIDHLQELGLIVLDLTVRDIRTALDISLEFGLVMADAAHLSVMQRAKISHLASADSDFNLVSSITLWSPKI
jgi:predicted nucleic acid-binding protein